MSAVPDKLFVIVGAGGLLNLVLGVAIVAVGAGIPGAVLAAFGLISIGGAWWMQRHLKVQPDRAGSRDG